MTEQAAGTNGHGDARHLLSPREREVMEMTSLGLTNVEIARRLNVTDHAIKFHLSSIFRKLHVSNRTEAAVAYLTRA